jgi:hypothetical protein
LEEENRDIREELLRIQAIIKDRLNNKEKLKKKILKLMKSELQAHHLAGKEIISQCAEFKMKKVELKENLNQAKQKAEKQARNVFTEQKRIKNNKDFIKLKNNIYQGRLQKKDVNLIEQKVFDLIKHSKRKKHQKDMLGVIQRQHFYRQQKIKERQHRKLKHLKLITKSDKTKSSIKRKLKPIKNSQKLSKS